MTAYFHGGVPGLAVGEWILSPASTGARSKPRGPGLMATFGQSDRVYFCGGPHALEHARGFAAGFPAGTVYEVQPGRPIEDDMADVYGNEWLSAPCARVIRVVERDVELTPEMRRWMNTPRDPSEAA